MTSTITRPRPVTEAPEPWTFPTFTRTQLDNGLRVIWREIPGQPLVSVALVVHSPLTAEPTGTDGIGAALAAAMTQGAGALSASEFANELESTGAELEVSNNSVALRARLDVAFSRLEKALQLLALACSEPTLEATVVERTIGRQQARLRNATAQAGWVAERAMAQTLFADHRLATGDLGTVATLATITPEAMRAHASACLRPAAATLVIAGDFGGADVIPLIERTLGQWQGSAEPAPTLDLPAGISPRLIVTDLPGAVQTHLSLATRGSRRADAGWEADVLAGYVLGGPLTSRLSMALREDKGYTYGIGAGLAAHGPLSHRRIQTSVEASVTSAALAELVEIAGDFARQGPTELELQEAITAKVAVAPLRLQTAREMVGEVMTAVVDELPTEWTEQQYARLAATTHDQVIEAAAGWAATDFTIVACGDAGRITPAIEALGLGPVEVVTVSA